MPASLPREELLQLMKFVCSFAWSDQEVRPEERAYVARLVEQLGLDARDAAQVQAWLRVAPPVEEVDPTEIPRKNRQLFVDAVTALISADGDISADEREDLRLFKQLLK